jgi:amidase
LFFDQALERATELDRLREKGTVLPLHGLPISLKDSFNVKGVHTTVAYVAFASRPPVEYNSSLVELLLEQGAVFYVKTNIPQTMMTADSDNPLFGRTLNPNKLSLTAGGSTGGEGALIAMRGSLLGAGTDVAGSVRIPALCNGIYGFKPTSQRVPFAGKTPPGRFGSPSPILPSIGPEAHSVRDLEGFMETVIDAQPWLFDDGGINVPWRRVQIPDKPLRFGFILEDPKRPVHPPMKRTMLHAKELVEKAGHEIVPVDLDLWAAAVLAWKYFFIDPKKTPLGIIASSGEPWVKSIATVLPDEVKVLSIDLDGVFDMNVERRKIMKTFHDVVVEKKLDAILLPPYQSTAVPHDTYGFPLYTTVANLLDWPAGSIPYLAANEELDKPYLKNEHGTDLSFIPPCE